jgi:hypothetical protein
MSRVERVESELRKLSQAELRQVANGWTTSSRMNWNSPPSSNTPSNRPSAIWPRERPRACVSLKARERSDPDLLRKFRRSLPQAATGSAWAYRTEDRLDRLTTTGLSAPPTQRIESVPCSDRRLSNHLHFRFRAEQDSSACDWASAGNLSQRLTGCSEYPVHPIEVRCYHKPLHETNSVVAPDRSRGAVATGANCSLAGNST